MSSPDNPLSGRRILVTRPPQQGAALLELVVAAGGLVRHRPAIDFQPPEDAAAADRAVHGLATFHWLVFTSPTGVRFFLERMRNRGAGPVPATVRMAVVGPGTAAAVREAGYRPDLVPVQADAEGLAAELAVRNMPGKRVLWVRPEGARPVLGKLLELQGAQVTSAIFYRTVPHHGCKEIAAELTDGRYDGVLFTSPSTFNAILDALPPDRTERFHQVVLVAIGRITAAAMEAAGCPPQAVAEKPTAEGVAAAFKTAFGPVTLC